MYLVIEHLEEILGGICVELIFTVALRIFGSSVLVLSILSLRIRDDEPRLRMKSKIREQNRSAYT